MSNSRQASLCCANAGWLLALLDAQSIGGTSDRKLCSACRGTAALVQGGGGCYFLHWFTKYGHKAVSEILSGDRFQMLSLNDNDLAL